MTAPTVRWLVHHPQDQLGTGGWVEYPDRPTADEHAGTTAKVWALVTPEVVRQRERVRELAAEHVEHADGCGLLAGQILEVLGA